MIRLTGDRFYHVPGEFVNNQYHADHTFTSIPDRKLRLLNSTVQWWKVDPHENARVIASDIAFSDMMVVDNARMWITNSTCEGQTIHLGALGDAVQRQSDVAAVYPRGVSGETGTKAWLVGAITAAAQQRGV